MHHRSPSPVSDDGQDIRRRSPLEADARVSPSPCLSLSTDTDQEDLVLSVFCFSFSLVSSWVSSRIGSFSTRVLLSSLFNLEFFRFSFSFHSVLLCSEIIAMNRNGQVGRASQHSASAVVSEGEFHSPRRPGSDRSSQHLFSILSLLSVSIICFNTTVQRHLPPAPSGAGPSLGTARPPPLSLLLVLGT